MLAEVEALVGAVDDDGVLAEVVLVEVGQHAPDLVVERVDAGHVVLHVALVAPADPGLALEGGLELVLAVGLVEGLVPAVPGLALLGSQVARRGELHVATAEVPCQRHRLGLTPAVAVRPVVEQGRGLLEEGHLGARQLLRTRLPVPVRRLVLVHQQERLVFVPILREPVEGQVGDHLGRVALVLDRARRRLDGRVVVGALADQDLPVIEADRVTAQVPLADHGRLVAGRLHELGEGLLVPVEDVAVLQVPVGVGVQPGQHRRAARSADRVPAEAVLEEHALARQPIDVRRHVARPAVGGDRVGGVVVAEDEDDVRAIVRGQGGRGQEQGEQAAQLHGSRVGRVAARRPGAPGSEPTSPKDFRDSAFERIRTGRLSQPARPPPVADAERSRKGQRRALARPRGGSPLLARDLFLLPQKHRPRW